MSAAEPEKDALRTLAMALTEALHHFNQRRLGFADITLLFRLECLY